LIPRYSASFPLAEHLYQRRPRKLWLRPNKPQQAGAPLGSGFECDSRNPTAHAAIRPQPFRM